MEVTPTPLMTAPNCWYVSSHDGSTIFAAFGRNDGVTIIPTLPEDLPPLPPASTTRGKWWEAPSIPWAVHGFISQDGVMTNLNKLIPRRFQPLKSQLATSMIATNLRDASHERADKDKSTPFC